MRLDSKTLSLYAVTDRSWVSNTTLKDQVREALEGGITFLQLREKDLSDEQFLKEAIEIGELSRRYNVPFIINDNVDIAIKSNADGVHVGQEDMTAYDVRKLIGDDKILGVSVQTEEQALRAYEQGADYLGVGAVFSTSTKFDACDVALETLKSICLLVPIPVVAIGGITIENINKLEGTNMDGAAVVSAIFSSEDIRSSCVQLKKEIEKITVKTIEDIEGAIFDMDGTLIDSMGIWDNIASDYLTSKQIEHDKNIGKIIKNMSMYDGAEYVRKHTDIKESSEEIVNGVNKLLTKCYEHKILLKEGVERYLEYLFQKNIPMCVATATDEHLAKKCLKRLGIEKYFKKILTCTKSGAGKESPKIFEDALRVLNTKRENTYIFEDSLYAVKTSKSVGFKVVGVYDENSKSDSIEIEKLSDVYVKSMSQFI